MAPTVWQESSLPVDTAATKDENGAKFLRDPWRALGERE